MSDYVVRPLDTATWPDFAALAERHGGVWGGCWCVSFHAEGAQKVASAEARRAQKEARVRAGTTHAALVYDDDRCIAWCQFGPPPELPRIKHRRQYEAEQEGAAPDWRITCFFVDREFRNRGVAATALDGALAEIARLGGGTVESFPAEPADRTSAGFIHNATVGVFERAGFTRVRRLGTRNWLVARTVPAA